MEPENQKLKIIACTGGAWEAVHGVLRYRPMGLAKRILQLPLNVTFSDLMTCVASKLNVSLQTGFRVTYQFPLSSSNRNKNVVVDIADDEDVEVFMDTALKASQELITLYVVESVPSCRDQSDTRDNERRPVFTYQHLFPEHEAARAAGTSENTTHVSESEYDFEDRKDWFLHQKLGSNGVDGDSDKDLSGSQSPAPDVLQRTSVSRNTGKGIWSWMHPQSPTRASDIAVRTREKDNFEGMSFPLTQKLFDNKEALKIALKVKCVDVGFKMNTTKSTKDVYQVRCVSDTCDWCISATRVQGTDMFQVVSFKVQHKC